MSGIEDITNLYAIQDAAIKFHEYYSTIMHNSRINSWKIDS